MTPIRTLALILVLATGGLTSAAAEAQTAQPVVRTLEGPVQGAERDGVRVFAAVPFAAPPVGPLRFSPPQPVAKWTQTLNVDRRIPNCIQFEDGTPAPQSEDCLYLGVFAPLDATPAKPKAVLVWIFGGGYTRNGAGGYNGADIAKDGDIVVVTVNYRLGLLGMLVDKSLDNKNGLSGNQPIRDQQAALRWVQRNIAAFGGDPKNVTLWGQSAGANSVQRNIVSPAAKDLFQKAIVMSGGSASTPLAKRADLEGAPSKAVAKAVGCEGKRDLAACLRAAPAAAYVTAFKAGNRMPLVQERGFLPLDTLAAFKSGQFNRVSVLNGEDLDDATFGMLPVEKALGHAPTATDVPALGKKMMGDDAALLLAQYPVNKYSAPDVAMVAALTDARQACPADSTRRALAAYVPVYGLEFAEPNPAQPPPDPAYSNLPNNARHASENSYIFGSRQGGPPLTGHAEVLSNRFQRYWSNFAKYGTPDPSGTEWPRFTVAKPVVLSMKEPPVAAADFATRHNCAWMKEKGIVKY